MVKLLVAVVDVGVEKIRGSVVSALLPGGVPAIF
jgi:hypothetical protein